MAHYTSPCCKTACTIYYQDYANSLTNISTNLKRNSNKYYINIIVSSKFFRANQLDNTCFFQNWNSLQCIFQDREQSVATVFKTEAVPVMRSRDKTNFHVGYFFDIAKGVNDLNKVVIKFPKKIIEHASCIKHLEVSGRINTAPSSNPAQQQQQSITTADSKVLDMMYPSHDHSHGWHGRANLNRSGTRDLIHKTS